MGGPARGSRQIGSQPALRRQNTQRVLHTLASRGPTTQANLVRITGLSTGTISNIVKVLDEEQRVELRPVVSGGRRAIEISLRDDRRVVVAIDVDRLRLRLAVARFDHRLVAEADLEVPAGHRPPEALALARRELDRLLDKHGLGPDDVAAGGLSVPAPTGQATLPAGPQPLDGAWHTEGLAQLAEDWLPCPVRIDTAANLGALAQVSWGPFGAVEDLAFVNVGSAVSAGLLIGGRIHRGHLGGAGELGHFPVVELGEHCYCGNRGCLETLASTAAIVRALRRGNRSGQGLDADAIVRLSRSRDLATLRVLEDAGAALGTALGAVANLLNPEVIVIGGPLAPIGAPLLDPVVRSMGRHTLPVVMAGTTVTMSHLGDRAGLLGAASLAIRHAVALS
ncbi:ROK family transcriptional regulator [Mariniluteicoccus flavus]